MLACHFRLYCYLYKQTKGKMAADAAVLANEFPEKSFERFLTGHCGPSRAEFYFSSIYLDLLRLLGKSDLCVWQIMCLTRSVCFTYELMLS